MQPKLLRVLESRTVRRVGETAQRPVNVRFLSATNRDLRTMVNTRAFREDRVDLLLTPTTPTPAFRAGEKTSDPVAMYLADIFVCGASLAGLPAMSLPAGRSDGLPVGVQLIAPAFGETRMLQVAAALEQVLPGDEETR